MSDRPRFPWESDDSDADAVEPPRFEPADEVEPEPEAEPPVEVELPEDDDLSIESVSFQRGPEPPPPTEEPPREPAPIPAEVTVTSLSRKRARTLGALVDALIPLGGSALPSGRGADVVRQTDAALRGFDEAARTRIARMLRLLEWAPVLSPALRTLSRLNAGKAEAATARALASRIPAVRAAAETCKDLIVSRWASDPAVERALHYDYSCTTADQPNARQDLEILTIDRDHVEDCDVVVVGSGAGGAVAARELAEVGLSVVVLEEGPAHGRAGSAGAPALRRDALYRAHGLARAAGRPGGRLLLGWGVGGTTLVSHGTAMRAPDATLDGWAASGLDGFDAESMRPYYERVERALRVQPMREDLAGPAARTLAKAVRERGITAILPRRAVEGCRGCGACDAGCPSDAIMSAAQTYLPRAQRAGATIIAGARAQRIIVEDGRACGIVARTASGATLTVRAKVVVLAAGAIHTPALLADSALGDLAGRLGRNLSLQPSTFVVGRFNEDQVAWRGVQQSLTVTEWLTSHGLLLHAVGLDPSSAGHAIPGAGQALSGRLEDLARTVAIGVSVADAGSGRVERGRGGHPRVTYDLAEQDARRLLRGVSHATGLLLAAGARSVMTGVAGAEEVSSEAGVAEIEDAALKRGGLAITGSAPAGTAAIGADPATGVCDPSGAVRGVEALFVTDASALPTCAGVPPMTTIMALATRTVDHLARQGGHYF